MVLPLAVLFKKWYFLFLQQYPSSLHYLGIFCSQILFFFRFLHFNVQLSVTFDFWDVMTNTTLEYVDTGQFYMKYRIFQSNSILHDLSPDDDVYKYFISNKTKGATICHCLAFTPSAGLNPGYFLNCRPYDSVPGQFGRIRQVKRVGIFANYKERTRKYTIK